MQFSRNNVSLYSSHIWPHKVDH